MDPTQGQVPEGVPTISIADVLELERKVRENRQAQLRGEASPHAVTAEQIRAAIQAVRRERNITPSAGGAKKPAKTQIEIVDLDGL